MHRTMYIMFVTRLLRTSFMCSSPDTPYTPLALLLAWFCWLVLIYPVRHEGNHYPPCVSVCTPQKSFWNVAICSRCKQCIYRIHRTVLICFWFNSPIFLHDLRYTYIIHIIFTERLWLWLWVIIPTYTKLCSYPTHALASPPPEVSSLFLPSSKYAPNFVIIESPPLADWWGECTAVV